MKNIIVFVFIIIQYSFLLAQNNVLKCVSGNCKEGWGRVESSDGVTYEGYFRNGQFNGKGTATYNKGDVKEKKGIFSNNKFSSGNLTCFDGRVFIGDFGNNGLEGNGTCVFPIGFKIIGQFKNGMPNGSGKVTNSKGILYDGNFTNGQVNGFGVFYSNMYDESTEDNSISTKINIYNVTPPLSTTRYIGEFKEGYISGIGIWYYSDCINKSGIWLDTETLQTAMNEEEVINKLNNKYNKSLQKCSSTQKTKTYNNDSLEYVNSVLRNGVIKREDDGSMFFIQKEGNKIKFLINETGIAYAYDNERVINKDVVMIFCNDCITIQKFNKEANTWSIPEKWPLFRLEFDNSKDAKKVEQILLSLKNRK